MVTMKIGAQLYTLREHMQNLEDISSTLKRVKDIGYNAIQVSGIGDFTKEKVEHIKKETEKYGLEICATHTNLPSLLNQFEWVVEYHKLWNCKYVGVGMMPLEYTETEEKVIEFTSIMNDLGKRLKEHGITLVYHNHAFEFRKLNGKLIMDILFDNFSDDVQFELDTFWIQKGGCNPVEWIEKVKGRMDVVHFKDMSIRNWDEQLMEVVGDGNLNWDQIISACLSTGVKYACVEQDDCQGREPFICLKRSLFFLNNKIWTM